MKNIKGFTLVELIIVISIIALLSTIGMTTYSSVQKDARNARRKSDLKEVKTALEAYKAQNSGDYPLTPANTYYGTCTGSWVAGGITYTGGRTDSDSAAPAGTAFIPGLAPAFIPKLPRDPRENKMNTSSLTVACQTTAGQNCYMYRSNGSDYKLIANCTPEGTMNATDTYYDSQRATFAWQVTSSFNSVAW